MNDSNHKFGFLMVMVLIVTIFGCGNPVRRKVDIYMRQGNWDKVRNFLERERLIRKKDGEVLLLLAETYGELDDYQRLGKTLEDPILKGYQYQERVRFIKEKYWRINYNKAIECAQNKKYGEAVTYLENSVLIRPDKPEPYNLLGQCYTYLELPKKAINAYKKHVDLSKKDWISCNNLAELYYRNQKYSEAIRYSEETLKRNPLHLHAQMIIAYSEMKQGHIDKAEEAFEKSLNMGGTLELFEEYGKFCLENDKYQLAKSLFSKALNLSRDSNNEFMRFYKYLAECCYKMEDFRNVALYYERYLQQNEEDIETLKNLLVAYARIGDNDNVKRIKAMLHDRGNGSE